MEVDFQVSSSELGGGNDERRNGNQLDLTKQSGFVDGNIKENKGSHTDRRDDSANLLHNDDNDDDDDDDEKKSQRDQEELEPSSQSTHISSSSPLSSSHDPLNSSSQHDIDVPRSSSDQSVSIPGDNGSIISSLGSPKEVGNGSGGGGGGGSGVGGSGGKYNGGEIDKERLLATIEMTKRANILQQRLALASFKTQRGWGELSLGEIEPKLPNQTPLPPSSPGDSTTLRKRKSHIQLSIASPTDAIINDQPPPRSPHGFSPTRLGFRSPTSGSFPQTLQSPTRTSFAGTLGGSRHERRPSGSRPRIAYIPPTGDGGGESSSSIISSTTNTQLESPRKRSRLEESGSYDSFMGNQIGNGRRGSSDDELLSSSSSMGGGRYLRPGMSVLDQVAEENAERRNVMGHRRVASGTRVAYPISPGLGSGSGVGAGAGAASARQYSSMNAPPSLTSPPPPPPPPRQTGLMEQRKKQRSQSHSGFHLEREGLPLSTDEMDLDAATALTSMLGSGSGRGASPSPVRPTFGDRFGGEVDGDHHGRNPLSNLALRNSAAVNSHLKPRSQSFAAVSPSFPSSKLSPSISHGIPQPYSPISQTPSSHARGGSSITHGNRRASTSSNAFDDESEDEDKKAAELMIFLAHSPSPMRNAKKRTVTMGNGTPGGIGRILFEDHLAGKVAAEGFSPGRFAGLAIESPRGRDANPRGPSTPSAAGDRMRMALDSGGDVEMHADDSRRTSRTHELSTWTEGTRERLADMEVDFPPIGRHRADSGTALRSPLSAQTATPLSATTSMDSTDEPTTPTSIPRAHEPMHARKVSMGQA